MDVTCERCGTEYEFDDALVSERGTTVKCTTCSHQFKVRRSDGVAAPERWLVRTVDGREIEFTALRELQASIAQSRVTRDDVLARGGARPRRLGSIAELEPFFASAGGISVPSLAPGPIPGGGRSRTQTPPGLGAVGGASARYEGSVAIPLPAPPRGYRAYDDDGPVTAPRVARRPGSIPPPPAPPPARGSVPPPPPGVVVAPETAPPLPQPPPRPDPMASTLPHMPPPFMRSPSAPPPGFPQPLPPPAAPPPPAPPPPVVQQTVSIERPTYESAPTPMDPPPPRPMEATARLVSREAPIVEVESARPRSVDGRTTMRQGTPERLSSDPAEGSRGSISTPPPNTPTPSNAARSSFTDEATFNEPRFSSPVASRRAGGARLIVGVVLAGLVVFLGATVGRKYLTAEAKPTGSGVSDERIATLLHDSDRSLLDGDIETANEDLLKASVAEDDPRVAVALARIAAIRADQRWLHMKLLPSGSSDEDAKRELDDAMGRLNQALSRAEKLAPNDPVVIRAKIDSLRMAGDREGARKLVTSLGSATSQPESGLSLAAIDLGEDKPNFGALVDRLRAAAASEQNLGRARGMLIYALARSGDTAGAKAELERLGAMPRQPALTKQLQAFVARAEKDGKSVDVGALPDVASADVPSDFHECLRLGTEARGKGDLKRAEVLFAAALQKNPGDTEAISGLADVARANKDNARATKLYEQVLASNPSYLPALAALADMKWDGGDHPGAIALYKQILDKSASGPYAARARERIGGGGAPAPGGGSGERRHEEGAVPDDYVAPQPGSEKAVEVPAGKVDTSDLPGGKPVPKTTGDTPSTPKTAPTEQPAPPSNGPPPGIDTSDLPGLK